LFWVLKVSFACCGNIPEDGVYTYLINSKGVSSSVGTGNARKDITIIVHQERNTVIVHQE
jgi:hypothetical protein